MQFSSSLSTSIITNYCEMLGSILISRMNKKDKVEIYQIGLDFVF